MSGGYQPKVGTSEAITPPNKQSSGTTPKLDQPVRRAPDRVHVARVEIGGDKMGRVFLSNGDELVGLRVVTGSAEVNDFLRFKVEGIIVQEPEED